MGDGDGPDSEMDDCFEKSKGRVIELSMDAQNSTQGYRCHNNVFLSFTLLTREPAGALVRDSGHKIVPIAFCSSSEADLGNRGTRKD